MVGKCILLVKDGTSVGVLAADRGLSIQDQGMDHAGRLDRVLSRRECR